MGRYFPQQDEGGFVNNTYSYKFLDTPNCHTYHNPPPQKKTTKKTGKGSKKNDGKSGGWLGSASDRFSFILFETLEIALKHLKANLLFQTLVGGGGTLLL